MSALSERINAANHQRWNSRQIEAKAKEAGFTLSNGTAHKVLRGTHGVVSDDTLRALAKVFGLKFDDLRALVGLPAGDAPWIPPVVSSRLTSIQRELLEALIHQLVRPTESAGTEHGKRSAEKTLTRKVRAAKKPGAQSSPARRRKSDDAPHR